MSPSADTMEEYGGLAVVEDEECKVYILPLQMNKQEHVISSGGETIRFTPEFKRN